MNQSNWGQQDIHIVIDVTDMSAAKVNHWVNEALAKIDHPQMLPNIALHLNIESTGKDRISRILEIVDCAAKLHLPAVAISDDQEDQWLPNLLEYLEPWELDIIADHSDDVGVVVIDGRPVDPIYTAATSAQRIQSVYSTLGWTF
ncbi:MAG: hypothetical protein IPH75_14760 [bacterium]|nr:hypothetical protein [bacterium]